MKRQPKPLACMARVKRRGSQDCVAAIVVVASG
jgi:hypothetical protein